MKYFNLKFLTFFLTALLAFGVGWADEVVAYTLTPKKGTNNSYTGNCDIEIDGITWNLTGNSQQLPWRIGGNSISNVDRTLYSKTSISENVSKIEVKHGAASSITVNSWTVIVSKNSDFSNPVSSLTPTFSANSTTTITRPDGADWSNCYFKFVYNLTVSGTSNKNKFLEFREAKFYDLSGGSVTPTCATPTFSLAGGSYYGTQSVSLSCETDGATIYYTTDGTDPTASSTKYTGAISISETTTLKAIAMKDGMDNSAIASATYTFPTVVTNLAGANALDKGTEFVYNGYAVVTHVVDNNQYQNADVWIRDNQGNAAYLFRAKPLGFKNGDVLQTGWTATKAVHNGLNEFTSVTMVKDGTAEAKPEIATEIKDTDVSKFVRLESISTIGNGVQWYDKFGTGETLDPNKTYNVEGIVGYNNGLQFYPISVEEVDAPAPDLAITLDPAEKSATAGENIEVTVTANTDAEVIYEYTCNTTTATLIETATGFTITSATAGTVTVTVNALDEDSREATATGTYTFTAAPEPGVKTTYKKVTSTDQVTTGKYLIVYENDNIAFDGSRETLDGANNIVDVTITDGEIETDKDIYFTYDATAQTLKSASNKYIGQSSYANGLKQDEDANKYTNSITIDDGNAVITALQSGNDNQFTTLRFNSATGDTNYRFRYYKSGQQDIQLYKEVTGEPVVPELSVALDPAEKTYTVGDVAKIMVTVENGNDDTVVTYKINGEEKDYDAETGIVLPNDKAKKYTVEVFATDGDREATATGNYTFTAAPAIGITLTATPEAETYTVGDKVNVKVATTDTIGNNVLITYTTNFTRDAEQTYDNEKGIDITSDQAGTVTLTVNVYDGYEHKDAVEGITTKTADYTFVKAPAISITFDPASGTAFNVGDEAKVKVNISGTIGEYEAEYKVNDEVVSPEEGYIILPNDKAGDVTLKVTVVDGYEHEGDSEASATYKFKAAEPIQITLTPAEGSYTVGTEVKVNVKIENTIGDYLATYTINDGEEQEFDGNDIVIPSDQIATVTLAVSVMDAYHDGVTTVTGQYVFSPMPVVAMPTFSLVAGSYTGPQQVIINCATKGATISYSTDGGSTWTVGNTVNVDKDMTIMAKAEKDGMTVSTTASATYVIITEEAPVTVNIKTGYYQIKNLGNGLYANVAGRKTLNFTDAPADKAGTVIYVDVENDGTVKSLRSQAADLQRYADRAMSYVPEVVKIVAKKLNADGSGEILGETGLGKILDKFNECFDHNLHVEQAEGGYRLYGKTPSMQPVVDFYRENKDKVEAKLPNLEAFINSALEKLKAKIGGSSVFTEFKLHDIWDKMGGTLTEPVDAASTMAFYREVLNNKNYVWDFAYQTAMIYVNNLMNHPRWSEVEEQLGEYAQYIDKIKQIRPEFKYYIVQKDGKPDFISEGNKDIIDDDPRTIWTLEKRDGFTVNFPEANKHNGEYVTTLYTDFAYTLPEGVTAYAVTEVSTQGVATLTALEGTIPAQTPVLLKSTAYGAQTVTLSTEAGTAPADNLLVGPDYLIKHYEFKTPQVESIFNFIKDKLPGFYEEYVAQYEYLMLKTAGTVGNKYFWNVNSDLDDLKDDCIVRSLAVDENGTLAFSDHWTTETNKAFLVDDANNPQDVIKLPSLRGDINKDGVISIIDVTALIDILLDLPDRTYLETTDTYPKGLDYEAADVNEKDGIEINDVTALIDILLNMPDQPAQGSGN